MVSGFTKHYYFCRCDKCGQSAVVEQTNEIYNGAQAARSLGWSFGKDKRVFCSSCRQSRLYDKHRGFIM